MIRKRALVRDVAGRIGRAVDVSLDALRTSHVEHEPEFTDRMLGAIEQAMDGYKSKGVYWTAKTLTSRGHHAQESRHGADFAGVASIDLPGFLLRKGFLAQAKMIEPRETLRKRDFVRMKTQCGLMLDQTPDAFVFLYSRSGVTVLPAISVLSSERRNPHEFYSRSVSRFYEEHLESFIGDRRLNAATPQMLESLLHDLNARSLLFLGASSG